MLQFDSNTFLDDNDESFVSIDLNDDKNECDICHQETQEPIVTVMLRDEFLKFERSFERTGDSLTKAHQICLDRWSSIIERNLQYNKKCDDDDFSRTNNNDDNNKSLKSLHTFTTCFEEAVTNHNKNLIKKDQRSQQSQNCKKIYFT